MNDKRFKRKWEQKKFFRTVYEPLFKEMGNLKDNQYIRVFQSNGEVNTVKFFNNVDDLVSYTSNENIFNTNTYFTLSTTNGESGKKNDLINRTVLGFDFDKKDFDNELNHKDIINRFKSLNLYYHAIIDSGNGYHVYMLIEPETNIKKVVEVTQAIGKRLGADMEATKPTQILRIPYTFNTKDKNNIKQVNTIHLYEKNIKRYSIDRLYNRFCTSERDKQVNTGTQATNHIVNNTNIPKCIEKILLEGSPEGERNEDLQRIVVTLRNRGKGLSEIKEIIKEWDYKSNFKDRTNYRVEQAYYKREHISLNCKGCKYTNKCFDKVESDFNFNDDHNLLEMAEGHTKYLKASKRKGVKSMNGNDILICGILKNHRDGLYRKEIEKELFYNGDSCLSYKTLTETLKNLERNKFIEVFTINRMKFYKVKEIRGKTELKYLISYAATYEAVKGNITTEELRLYNYMRYLHNRQQREDSRALKGNLFYFSQVDLANDLDITQGRVSQMIENLLSEKLLSIWHRQPSKNNGFDYYIYRLNY